jgi:hypothetical protein
VSTTDQASVDLAVLWDRPDVATILVERDITALFKLLQRCGLSQREIARRTGQQQSEIAEIIGGRRVNSYDLLVRVSESLQIPRGRLGLAYDPPLDTGRAATSHPGRHR